MSTNAIPAPANGPANQPDPNLPGGPAAGLLAGMLAPVDPARATFDLTPTAPATDPSAATDAAVTQGSSDTYHGDGKGTEKDDKKATQSRQEKSVVKAWLLAGATRWAKGGGVQNKRLDLKKAQATAQQVKETRQVTLNRSNGLPSKGSNSSGAGPSNGKNSSDKGIQKPAPKGPKNSNGSVHQKPSGNSPGNPGTGPGGGRGPGGRGEFGGKPSGRDSGASKKDGPKNSSAGRAGADSKGSTDSGRSPKGSTHGPTDGKSPASKDGPNGKPGKPSGGQSGKTPDTKTEQQKDSTKTPKKVPLEKTKDTGKKDTGAAGAGKDGTPTKGDGSSGKPGEIGKDTKTAPDAKDSSDSETGATADKQKDRKPFSTQGARETGYRDGTRAAHAAAQGKAYVDGAKDGWTDGTEAAAREKARLDKAHQDRKNTRDKEQPVTATSADYHQPQSPQPIEVAGVTADHVLLGTGAARGSLTRGEVRTLKGFEVRLGSKAETMAKIAEGTKGLKRHADQQATKATRLLEEAKGVKGGEKLAATLAKLAEAAKVQAGKAADIHTRALRAAEGCRVVLSNAETRYGGMYKAVVDSGEPGPAEMSFYKDHGVTSNG